MNKNNNNKIRDYLHLSSIIENESTTFITIISDRNASVEGVAEDLTKNSIFCSI